MNVQKLTLKQSWLATCHFLRGLWEQDPKKFTADGNGLGAYLCFSSCEYKKDIDWRRVYYQRISKEWDDQDTISPEKILDIIQSLLEEASKKYGFELTEVKNVVEDLRKPCDANQEKLLLWSEALVRGMSDQERSGIS